MNRIINSLATAEYNKTINAVEVNFKGVGTSQLYYDTLDIAMNISLVYHTNQWLFRKTHFKDLGQSSFLSFLKRWSAKANCLYAEHLNVVGCKAALYTTAESYLYMLSQVEISDNPEDLLPNMEFKIFTNIEAAQQYLNQGKEPKIAIST